LAPYGGTTALTAPPRVRVWEVGWKQALFDHRVIFSIDYYNQFWDNALVETYLFDPTSCKATYGQTYAPNTSATCAFGSTGSEVYGPSENHIQGIEFEGTARVTPKLTLHSNVDWTYGVRDKYSETDTGPMFISGVTPNEDGNRIDEVPEWQAEGDATYKDHLTDAIDWYAHGNFTYTGSQYIDPTDIGILKAYVRVNASIGIVKGNWTLEIYSTNLLNDKNWDSAYRFPSSYEGYQYTQMSAIVDAPNPRDVGFKLSAKY